MASKKCFAVMALAFTMFVLPFASYGQSFGFKLRDENPSAPSSSCKGLIDQGKIYSTIDEAKQAIRDAAIQGSGGEGVFLERFPRQSSPRDAFAFYQAYPFVSPIPGVVWLPLGRDGRFCSSGKACCDSYLSRWGPNAVRMIYSVLPPFDSLTMESGSCEVEFTDGSREHNCASPFVGGPCVFHSGLFCPEGWGAANMGLYNPQTESFDHHPQGFSSGTTNAVVRIWSRPAEMCVTGRRCDISILRVPLSRCIAVAGPAPVEPDSPLPGLTARVTDCQGNGLGSVGVRATVEVQPNSGWHGHHDPSRPAGKLSTGGSGNPGTAIVTGTTDVNGEFRFDFTAPAAAGIHLINAVCSDGSCNASTPHQVIVKVDGLEQIPTSSWYTLNESDGRNIGDNGKHDGVNHFLTREASHVLELIAENYAVSFGPLGEVPRDPEQLHINDASLPWGGLFDITGNWTTKPGHVEHRRGTVVDIRANNSPGAIPAYKQLEFEQIAADWLAEAKLHSRGKMNQHYHVRLLSRGE